MYSIGVDIGTSTTEIILSSINITTHLGPSLLPVTDIEKIEVIYRSPVFFTPFLSLDWIDFEKIRKRVQHSIQESGIPKEQIETGAVIITGETARKENASQVSKTLAEYLGDFVVATAGPKLESILAGHGAGIAEESKVRNRRILNLDIGGGTLNAVVFDSGVCKESFAMDIGGRLIQIDKEFTVTYLSQRIRFLIEDVEEHSFPVVVGQKVTWEILEEICERLAEYCLQACGLKELTKEAKLLFITEISSPMAIDYISISGGVGEYVMEGSRTKQEIKEIRSAMLRFGDIGPLLGMKLTEALLPYKEKVLIPKEKIRATVIGAGSHSLSISGSTIGFDETILPIQNIPIIKSPATSDQWEEFYALTKPLMELYEENVIAVSIQGKKSPGYAELKILAKQIAKLYQEIDSPIIILLKEDFAKALSQMIRIHTDCSKPIVCLDKIHTEYGDYIDIGTPIGSAIPVVIKTLLYQS